MPAPKSLPGASWRRGDLEIEQAHADRIRSREVRKEQNIDAVASKAYAHLPPVLPATPVDPDWTAQFLRIAGDVSNEDMQTFWARLLAGEIASPGSFSKRTVATLGILSHTDAIAVEQLSSVIWETSDEGFIALAPDDSTFGHWGLSTGALLELQSLGLISDVDPGLELIYEVPRGENALNYHGWIAQIRNTAPSPVGFGLMLRLTSLGVELCRVAGNKRSSSYFSRVVTALRDRGLDVAEMRIDVG
jgi:hypothetical protein